MKHQKQLSFWIGLALVALGCGVLLGWLLGIEVLKSLGPGLATMKPNTAVGFIVGGVGLWLLGDPTGSAGRRRAGLACGAFLAVLGGVTWSEYLFLWDAGIDDLLMPTAAGSGKMSGASAVCSLMSGLALLLLDRRIGSFFWPAQWLALGVATGGLMGVLGHIFGPEFLYRVLGFGTMSLHTAAGFSLLAVGLVVARPDHGWARELMSDGFGGVVARYLMPAAVLLPLTLGMLRRFGERKQFFDAGQGTLFFTLAYVVLFVALIWWLAVVLNNLDEARREREERARLLNESLEERVAARTAELRAANARLETEAATRRAAEEAHRRSEERHRSLIEQLPQLVWTCLPDGRCDYLSPQWVAYTGIPEAPQLGYGWTERVHPDDRERATSAWKAASTSGTPLDVDFRIRRADGVYRWFKTRAQPLRDQDGKIISWFGTNTDVDDQRRVEEELRRLGQELEQRVEARTAELADEVEERRRTEEALAVERGVLREVLESVLSGHWDWDLRTGTEYLSPRFKSMFGYEDHEMANTPESWQRIIFPEDLPAVLDNFRRHVESHGAVPFYNEVRYRHRDGSTVWVICAGRVIEWAKDGVALRMVGCHVDITGMKRAQGEVEALTRRLKIASEGAGVGIWEWDVVANRLVWDDLMYQLYGTDRSRFPGAVEAWENAVHPDDKEESLRRVQRALSGEEGFNTRFRIRCEDGTVRHIQAHGVVIRDAAGKPLQMIGTNWDLTEQVAAEAELRKSRERFQRLFESSPDAVLIVDRPGRIVQANGQAAKLFGYTVEELLALDVEALVPERFRQRHVGHRANFHANPHARPMGVGLDLFGRRKGGEEFHIDLLLSPMEDEGQPRVMAVVRDISQRKETEAALRVSEERFRNAVKYSAIGMALVSTDGRWLQVNSALCEILGYEEDALLKLTFQDLTHPDDLGDDLAHVAALLAGEITNYQMEKRYLRASGGTVWAHLNVSLVRRPSGEPEHFVAQIQDVSERVRAREDLERAVAELERSNRDLQQFAYVASHDLQEPLRAVGGCADILRVRYRGKLDARADELIHHVVDGAQRMQRLIHDLLDYSRAGRQESELESVDLAAAMAEALANLRSPIEESGAEVRVGPLPVVQGYSGRLVQLLQNLVGNALKYRSERAPVIEIFTEEPQGTGMWRVSVRDNGIGIESRYFHKIFGIFQRLHTRSQYEGTGIGLAVCKRIVEAHGGEIGVESVPGAGSTFHFTLPKSGVDGASTGSRSEIGN